MPEEIKSAISFDVEKMRVILEDYKKRLKPEIWSKEDYKWKAIKTFQNSWNIEAEDLAGMLDSSLKDTDNLLTSARRYAKGMIVEYATLFPDEVRSMFINLFDESIDVYERIKSFIDKSDELLPRWSAIRNKPEGRMHYQNINAVTTYLWLRYPDKYYIFKLNIIKTVTEKLGSTYVFKKGAYADNVRCFLKLYDEIRNELQKDEELKNTLAECIDSECYDDPYLNTLTIDFGYFIGRYYSTEVSEADIADDDEFDETDPELFFDEWSPSLDEYSPGFTKEQWLDLLNNKNMIGPVWGGVLAAFYEFGGSATCSQIAQKYHKSPSGISGNCTQLAKSIYKKTNCPLSLRDNGKKRYWPILFQGKKAGEDTPGDYIWKLRTELYDALKEFDIMRYQWPIDDIANRQYWWLNANPRIWSFYELPVGETISYELYNDNGNKRRVFQNFLDAKVGDIVIGYESTPRKQIVALAEVAEEQDGETILFKKTEGLPLPVDFQTIKNAPGLENMEFLVNPQGSLFKLTEDEYSIIIDIIREINPKENLAPVNTYTEKDFLKEVYMSEDRYHKLVSILKNKKNIILQGAPGVGKTFAAKRLAYSMMGKKDDDKIEFVQFHQNYSYEDFVMGYKPSDSGFELKDGIFYRFCQKAANQPDKVFFFIIDEINRGNMSKIFGELLMLIEKDYRGTKLKLAYNGMSFAVPENLYIIGMMNTADRSLAMIDYALRRRFSFFEMSPGFDSEGFINHQNNVGSDTFDELISRIKDLNKEISSDRSLGKGFCIGHSYFCSSSDYSDDALLSIVDYEIIPMLEEYWFDDETKLRRWINTLQGVFSD